MIDEATITAIIVMPQRKMKCLIRGSYWNFVLRQTRARNCLPIAGGTVNGLTFSTLINLCPKRTKLSKAKLAEDRRKPANRRPEYESKKSRNRAVHWQYV